MDNNFILPKTLNINCNSRYYSPSISSYGYNYPPGGGNNLATGNPNALSCWVSNVYENNYILKRVWRDFLFFKPEWLQYRMPAAAGQPAQNGPLRMEAPVHGRPAQLQQAMAQNPALPVGQQYQRVPYGSFPNRTQNIIWEVVWDHFPGDIPRPPGYNAELGDWPNRKYPRIFRIKINISNMGNQNNPNINLNNIKNNFEHIRRFLPTEGAQEAPHRWLQIEFSPTAAGFYLNYTINLRVGNPGAYKYLPFSLFHCSFHYSGVGEELPELMGDKVNQNAIDGVWHFKSDNTEWNRGLFPYNIIDSMSNGINPALPQYTPLQNFASDDNIPNRLDIQPSKNKWARHELEGNPDRRDTDHNWHIPFIFNYNANEAEANFINFQDITQNINYTSADILHTGSQTLRQNITPDDNYQQVLPALPNNYCSKENYNTRRDIVYKNTIHNDSPLKIIDYENIRPRIDPIDPVNLPLWENCCENKNNHQDIMNAGWNPAGPDNQIAAPNDRMRVSHVLAVLSGEYNRIVEIINNWIHIQGNIYNPVRINQTILAQPRLFHNSQPINEQCRENNCSNPPVQVLPQEVAAPQLVLAPQVVGVPQVVAAPQVVAEPGNVALKLKYQKYKPNQQAFKLKPNAFKLKPYGIKINPGKKKFIPSSKGGQYSKKIKNKKSKRKIMNISRKCNKSKRKSKK